MSNKVIELRKVKRARRVKKLGKIVLILAIICASLYFSRIDDVRVVGESRYEDREILEMLDMTEPMNYPQFYMKKYNKTKLLPFIESVEIKQTGLMSAKIVVNTKDVVSLIPFQTQYIALDEQGLVLGYDDDKREGVPVSRGLHIDEAIVGTRLDVDSAIIDAIISIYYGSKKQELKIDEIFFLGGKSDNIHLYFDEVDVFMGDAKNADKKIQIARKVLEKLPSNARGVLDISVDSDNYVFKNTFDIKCYLESTKGYIAVDEDLCVRKISHSKFDGIVVVSDVKVDGIKLGDKLDGKAELLANVDKIRADFKDYELRRIRFKDDKKSGVFIDVGDLAFAYKDMKDVERKNEAARAYLNDENKKKYTRCIEIDELITKYIKNTEKKVD